MPFDEGVTNTQIDFNKPVTKEQKLSLLPVLKAHINFFKKPIHEKQLSAISKSLGKVLGNPFYNDVKLSVNVTIDQPSNAQPQRTVDSKLSGLLPVSQAIKGTFSNTDEKPEITLNVTIDRKGQMTINHIVDKSYLKEFEGKWEKEAKARGLKVNIPIMRQGVIAELESEVAKKTFYQRFVQKTKALFTESIADYAEAILATQKVAKNVWKEGQVNKSTWFSEEQEHDQWPEYMQLPPVVGGIADGAVDQIVGIKMTISTIYDLATDDEKRAALGQVFTAEGASKVFKELRTQADETLKNPELGGHFVGKTTVEVGTMLMGGAGALTSFSKLQEVTGATMGASRTITNTKVLEVLSSIRKSDLHKPEILKAVEDFLSKIDPKILDAFADAPGFDKAVREMSQQWSKFHGGTFVLDYAGKLIGRGKTIRFEVETFNNYMGKKIDFRRHDIEFEELLPNGDKLTIKLELKNWTGFWEGTIKTQFVKDLKKIDSFDQLKWVFNKKGMNQNIDELRKSIIKSLRKSDGTPVDELKDISYEKVIELFPGQGIDRSNFAEKLIENLDKPEVFSKIFEIVE